MRAEPGGVAGWRFDDFLAWEARQERRHELVGGEARMMAGGTQAHALIAANLVALLRPLLRGSPCRPSGSDLRVPIPITGNVRYPDVTVDCGPFDPASPDASEPRIVFEVLSKSTGWYDQTQKLRDYAAVASIRQYICVSQSERRVGIWRRADGDRLLPEDDLFEENAVLPLCDDLGVVGLSDIYEGIGFPAENATAFPA